MCETKLSCSDRCPLNTCSCETLFFLGRTPRHCKRLRLSTQQSSALYWRSLSSLKSSKLDQHPHTPRCTFDRQDLQTKTWRWWWRWWLLFWWWWWRWRLLLTAHHNCSVPQYSFGSSTSRVDGPRRTQTQPHSCLWCTHFRNNPNVRST